ncbi:uncharacterized protein CcaverHIS019_0401370 [Cutaneotrichosporon cavernicola]|uniref:ADF-H domain-containing protein n=1 Tax=Cutaneotrichosporon cavernicola TaxID=279322 RepID=A0AA48L3K5_9TREE|nr:uncharacterized protein CcaverHIS019_0401370 [Cutaneotrichosporon cavernicola]BEI91317.1 hypothetical protein CcaverHIS019_0401370 [Cutaneotrichosporon cavernicola]BEI99090.1 hypothetical protein CcaverHIS631_0401330 [Cutaneotrichosporon cavernicola]BEJ06864.1 hypothetical protein CcaverHIS641_0401330 [Cutaneotrichosporon cavernicola]
MSAQSGIRVPTAVTEAFSAAQRDAESTRAVVFMIDGEAFKHVTSIPPKGSFSDDIALLPDTLPDKKTPASFAYRLDSKSLGAYEWMMVTFVPDNAGVRAKMLQASSRAGLMKSLGANNFKHDWFATSTSDLSPHAFKSHLNHMASPPPLTASEAALAEIKAAEAEEARRTAVDGEVHKARVKAVIGLSGKTKWQAGVHEALSKAAERSDDGWIVTLEIDAKDTAAINLLRSEACKPNEVASKMPDKSPAYVFYSFPTSPPPKPVRPTATPSAPAASRDTFQATAGGVRNVMHSDAPRYDAEEKEGEDKEENGKDDVPDITGLKIADEPKAASPPRSPSPEQPSKGRVVFIYWCPTGSPVKYRMVYSTTVRGIQQDAQDKVGMEVVGKLETSDKSDLTDSSIRDAVPAKKSASLNTGAPRMFGAPAPAGRFGAPAPANAGFNRPSSVPKPSSPAVFGAPATFGQPRPIRTSSQMSQGSGNASPAAASPAPNDDEDESDSSARIQNAFNAFGPRVGGGGNGGGFARPRGPGRR